MKGYENEVVELLDSSGGRLYALLVRLTLREDIAEELMQELFIKLSHARGFRNANNPYAYACRVAINLASDHHRWRKNHMTQELPQIAEPVARQPGPLAEVIRTEQLDQIVYGVARLSPKLRTAFVMRHLQHDSYETLAAQLGKTPQQARALCQKARNKLRTLINNQYPKKEDNDVQDR